MFEKYLFNFLKAWGGAIATGVLAWLQTDDWKTALGSALIAGGVVAGTPNTLGAGTGKRRASKKAADDELAQPFEPSDEIPGDDLNG